MITLEVSVWVAEQGFFPGMFDLDRDRVPLFRNGEGGRDLSLRIKLQF